jgi:hypothetical protein
VPSSVKQASIHPDVQRLDRLLRAAGRGIAGSVSVRTHNFSYGQGVTIQRCRPKIKTNY